MAHNPSRSTHLQLPGPPHAAFPDPTPTLEAARGAFETFLSGVNPGGRVLALHDFDADGLAAGVIWQRALERLGLAAPTRVVVDRERSPWTEANRARVAAARPERLFVLDLGSRPEAVLAGVPACFVDHHRPDGVAPGDTLISAYSWSPAPTTSLLVWELCAGRVDVSDLEWVAAVGIIGDLGERAPFELLASARRRYTAKYLKETTTLINAARRAASYDPEAAARALRLHDSPRALVDSPLPEVEQLRSARAEVKVAMEEAKKAAPVFAGKVALVRVSSRCQVHPLIAQIWRTRLPGYVVIVANDAYLPGRVNFSARSAAGTSALDLLRGIALSEGEGSYGHGHDQASGGSLPPERWDELLERLGFPVTVRASTTSPGA